MYFCHKCFVFQRGGWIFPEFCEITIPFPTSPLLTPLLWTLDKCGKNVRFSHLGFEHGVGYTVQVTTVNITYGPFNGKMIDFSGNVFRYRVFIKEQWLHKRWNLHKQEEQPYLVNPFLSVWLQHPLFQIFFRQHMFRFGTTYVTYLNIESILIKFIGWIHTALIVLKAVKAITLSEVT